MDPYARTILVLSTTGVVGGRLVSGILKTTACDVVVAGRGPAKLAAVPGRAGRVMTVILDTQRVKPNELRATGACAVIDAAGPFQGSSYRLAQAAIAAGLHYIDLADARDFVAGFGALDQAARTAGVIALCGASSAMGLTFPPCRHSPRSARC